MEELVLGGGIDFLEENLRNPDVHHGQSRNQNAVENLRLPGVEKPRGDCSL